jgi:NAD(P)-dependent dehydrogenase (short-subunit alcohol dehydrogenase family)
MALEFAAAGADVAINWLDDNAAAQRVADEVGACGRRAILVQADVAQVEQVQAMVSSVQEGLGAIGVLINNAGVFPRVPFLEMTEHDWDHVLDVNLKGSCFCAQCVAKAMVSAGRRGVIVNIASGAALRGSPRGVHYVASKGGILSLTRAMALELAPYRIRVNAIAPGLTDTAQPRYGSSEAEIVEMAGSIPLGRMALPGEIAEQRCFWHPKTRRLSPVRPCM